MRRLYLIRTAVAPPLALLALAACQGDSGAPGDLSDREPFSEIAPETVLRFTGTEPFWGGSVEGQMLTWSTPENIDGTQIVVERFAGRGGLSFSGELDGRSFDLAITPGECSDGMSDRAYPYVATVSIGEEVLYGCAYEEGEQAPIPPVEGDGAPA